MLTSYITAAMQRARYELLDDQPAGPHYGEIPGFAGVWANGATYDDCREELQRVLEGWIVLGLRLGHVLPTIDGIDLTAALDVAA